MKVLAYHGTAECDFTRFGIARAEPFNVGLHFCTKAAALSIVLLLHCCVLT